MEVGSGGKVALPAKPVLYANGPPAKGVEGPPAPSTSPVPSAPAAPGIVTPNGTETASAAAAQFEANLASSGAFSQDQLSQISAWATGQLTGAGQPNNLPVPYDQIALNFQQTPVFQARFPGMAKLAAQGIAITPAAYVSAESGYMSAAQAAGLPAGSITPAEAGVLIGGNVSLPEFNQRVSDAATDAGAAAAANPDVVASMKSMYGVGPGDLTSFFLNPTYTVNQVNQRTQAAQIGGAAMAAGFNPLSVATATTLQQQAGNSAAPGGTLSQSDLNQKFAQESNILGLTKQVASSNGLNTVDQSAETAQALGVATGAQGRDIMGALQSRAGAASGGGGYATTERGSAIGSGTEQGAKGDKMSGQG